MKITLVGATGGVGRLFLDQALADGHDVTAVVRNPATIPGTVPTATVDLAEPDMWVLHAAVAGADAVVSCLGPRTKSDVGVATAGTRAVVDAMQKTGVRRLVVISAAPVSGVPSPARPHPPRRDPGDGVVTAAVLYPLVRRVLSANYADLAHMEDVVRGSGLDWTVVRPPRLVDAPVTGRYRQDGAKNLKRGMKISRADTAHFLLQTLTRPETVGREMRIAY